MSFPLELSAIALSYILDSISWDDIRSLYHHNPLALRIAVKYILNSKGIPSIEEVAIFLDPTSEFSDKLHIAASSGSLLLVNYFLDIGVDIHVWNDIALESAIRGDHLHVAKLLLDRGANVNERSVSSDNPSMIELLLDHKADIRQLDNLITSAANGGNLAMMQLLLDRKVDICTNKALSGASRNGHLDVVKLLLDHKANPDEYVLRNAIHQGHLPIISLLIDYKADIHAQNDKLLRDASEDNQTQVVKLLLERGANITMIRKFSLERMVRRHPLLAKLIIGKMLDN